jgi:hypothetical protein
MKLMRIQPLALILFVSTLFFPLFANMESVSAETSGTWINIATVKVGENEYTDEDPWDSDVNLKFTGNGCTSTIDVSDISKLSEAKWKFQERPAGGNCSGNEIPISLSTPENYLKAFAFQDENTIVRVDGNSDWTFGRDGTSQTFLRTSEQGNDCQDVIVLRPDGSKRWADVYEHDPNGGSNVESGYGDCKFVQDSSLGDGAEYEGGQIISFLVGVKEDIRVNPDEQNLESATSCESEGGSLSWILCPVLFTGDAILRKLDQALVGLLEVPNDYFDETKNPELEVAWSRIRDIAYILLIPIILIMVIGTALGYDLVSAYTVKKALPRLVAAIIFIALSFEITKFLIIITNDVGSGIGGLITGAFTGADSISLATVFSPNNSDSIVAAPIFAGALVGGLAIGSLGIILSYLFVAIIGLGVGFFLLSLRQMLLIALMLLAPVAILSWIFPGNDKLWKLWWGTFTKLLLLFPLIMFVVAIGKSFALMVAETDGSFVSTLLKLIAYVGPYFMIPAIFKFAGGVFATVSGIANDRGRGLFDRNKKYRAEKAAKNWSEFKTGDKPWRRKAFNSLGMHVGAGWKGRFGVGGEGSRGKASMDLRRRMQAAERQKDPLMNQMQFDDDGIFALTQGSNAVEARRALMQYRQRLVDNGHIKEAKDWGWDAENNRWKDTDKIDKAIATASIAGFNKSNQAAAFDMMARNKSFSLVGGPAGMETMIAAANSLADGNKQMADNIMGSFEFNSRQAGRFDLGMHNYGDGTADMGGAWKKVGLYQLANGTGASMGAFGDYWTKELREGLNSGDVERIKRAKIAKAEFKAMLPNATADNQERINKALADMEIMDREHKEYISTLTPEQQAIEIPTMEAIEKAAEAQSRTYERFDPNREQT